MIRLVVALALLAAFGRDAASQDTPRPAVPKLKELVTVTAENQSLMVAQLDADAVIRSLGFHDGVSASDMAHALDELSQSLVPFAAQVAAKPVFDHLGAQRVVEAMSRLDSGTRQ